MTRAIRKVASSLGVCALMTTAAPLTAVAAPASFSGPQCVGVSAPTAPSRGSGAAQVSHDAQAGATFFFSRAFDGGVRIQLQTDVLQMEKTVYPDGHFEMQMQAGDDRVAVAFGIGGLDVVRGNRTTHVDIGQAADEDWLQVRLLLAGSKALRLFRMLAFSLDPATLKKPGGASVQTSDALLGFLDGDLGAVARLGERMRAARSARIRQVSLVEDEGANPCYDKYVAMVVAAADDYSACRKTFSWYNPWQAACVAAWTLQAESAWFQFLACSAIPIKTE